MDIAAPNQTPALASVEMGKHFYWLDAARFLAAFFVLLEHARGVAFLPWGDLSETSQLPLTMAFFATARLGTEAVVVFFVLSGFLVGGPGFARILCGRFRLRDYVIDRTVRLMLPLLPAIALTVFATYIIRNDFDGFGAVLGNAVFLQGLVVDSLSDNSPLWSLAYEFWFYFLVSAVFLISRSSFLGFSAFCLFLLIFRYLHTVFLFSWLIGAAVYFVDGKRIGWYVALFGAVATVSVVVLGQLASVNPNGYGWFSQMQPVLLMSVLVALVLRYLSERRPGQLLEMVETRLGACGRFSYTLYLTHFPILGVMRHYFGIERSATVGLADFLVYVALIAGCLFVAYAIYLMFEKNTASVKNWIRARA